MKYLDLLQQLQKLTPEQLQMTVTVEDGIENECYAAELRITDTEHDSLDENHPVIFFDVNMVP